MAWTDVPVVVVGCGASQRGFARLLAAYWARELHDCADDLLAITGMSTRRLLTELGAERLHRLQEQHLLQALDLRPAAVVSPALVVIDRLECRDLLRRKAFVVWLDEVVVETHVVLLEIAERRRPLFVEVADVVVRPTAERQLARWVDSVALSLRAMYRA